MIHRLLSGDCSILLKSQPFIISPQRAEPINLSMLQNRFRLGSWLKEDMIHRLLSGDCSILLPHVATHWQSLIFVFLAFLFMSASTLAVGHIGVLRLSLIRCENIF